MELMVCDRNTIERGIVVPGTYVVISIHDTDRPRAKVKSQPGLRDVLFLAFNDAEPDVSLELPAEVRAMTAAQADQIRDFVRKHEHDVDLIVVHCHSGVSRSPAVAAAISTALHLDARKFWQLYTPNRYVYHTVADAFERAGEGDRTVPGRDQQ